MTRIPTVIHDRLPGDTGGQGCDCVARFDGDRLCVDATNCEDGGRLEASANCRCTVLDALTDRDADTVRVRASGVERVYEGDAAALLVAAGRFAEAARHHDERLARLATRDPIAAAREAVGRADATADIAAESGLAGALDAEYETILAPLVGSTISDWRIDTAPPSGATLDATYDLDTGATVRIYDRDDGRDRYVLSPPERDVSKSALETLAEAHKRLADGSIRGERSAGRAVRAVAEADDPVERLVPILEKHTRGHGLLRDLFTDPDVSDVFVTAPVQSTPLYVRVGDETLPTNVRPTESGLAALSSRFRRESGRGFSRADPTIDATTEIAGRRIRVAGVTEPVSDGVAFAFRAHDRTVWTLSKLVANGTLPAGAAGLLSLCVERGGALLLAGARGTGKTTLLASLLWEIPETVRTILIEDTPELPADALRDDERDVQALRASDADAELGPAETLRAALRLGGGALVVGEIRGEEAGVLYEAMRVGANSEAVLGTVHGDGADAVYERVVADLGVPESSFGVTDGIVTLERGRDGQRQVGQIEEVRSGDRSFAGLYERADDGSLTPTGRIDRGNSRLVESLNRADETYADVRSAIEKRTTELAERADRGRSAPSAVENASAGQRP